MAGDRERRCRPARKLNPEIVRENSAHAIKIWCQDDVSRSARYWRPAEKLFRAHYHESGIALTPGHSGGGISDSEVRNGAGGQYLGFHGSAAELGFGAQPIVDVVAVVATTLFI